MTKPLLPPTEPFDPGLSAPPRRPLPKMLKIQYQRWLRRWRRSPHPLSPSFWVVGGVALTAALATIQNPIPVQLLERNAQTFFFDLRGLVVPPGNNPDLPQQPEIVILAMDGDTMTQGTQIYPSDPKQYAYFEPIQQWPWQRTAYAIVIERLMQAGARAVVLDVVLDANSSYGDADDARLQQVLKRYPGRVTLAAKYVEEAKRTGFETQLLTPNPIFQAANPVLGFINLPLSANGRMHQLGSVYWQQTQAQYAESGIELPQIPSLAEGALQAAQVDYPAPLGQDLFFYGPSQTFRHIPFWHVLDPQNWQGYHLKNQTFQDKIVLIGPTGGGESFQDFHLAPFSGTLRYPEKMAGVEIQANAIATLMQGRTLMPLFTHGLQGVLVVGIVVLAGYVQNRHTKRLRLSQLLHRFGYGLAIALGYGLISYVVFVQGRLILPTAVPMLAIGMGGLAALAIEIVGYQRRIRRDMENLPDTSTDLETDSPYETAEAQEVLERRKKEFLGSILKGRYQVDSEIGKGGFGETYLAKDLQRPGTPFCVVKRLRPQNKSDKVMRLAEKLFKQEAEVLQQLGHHDQIPDLLAFFNQDNDFYLVQQYVHGKSLADELTLSTASRKVTRPLNEQAVVMLLYELLHILDFVHHHKVIHRDIKPANIIRRQSDRKLVLIDFGAVKQVRELVDVLDDGTQITVPIGTSGYMAPEQAQGYPKPGSDIYSLGMTGIRALTGIEPRNLDTNQQGESQGIDWRETLKASVPLIQILEKMTCFNLSDRYQTAQAVLVDLLPLVERAEKSGYATALSEALPPIYDDCSVTDETKPWQPDSPDLPLPPTDPELSPTDALAQGDTQVGPSEPATDPTIPATDALPELPLTDAELPSTDPSAELPPTDAEES